MIALCLLLTARNRRETNNFLENTKALWDNVDSGFAQTVLTKDVMKKNAEPSLVKPDHLPASGCRGNGKATKTARPQGAKTAIARDKGNLREMTKAVADIPVVDAQRVALVRKALLEGSYKVDPERVAGKLIQFEKTLL